ncbi:MAG: hypothetical protein ACD_2C00088G0011 [uncultured bacterium (gcode 4)]|uniref:Primosomal protein N' 3' DNA-binding domain-containing protein n=1 Tax=uncultured bacterium (gcode 4) TaxID=1234023 RepID=K2FF60_9BACT|nr:MAG: hypothetical protein ACD_2C00088G0011 [uncultured bacterium (gcode 4)]
MYLKVLPLDISFDKEWLTYFFRDEEKAYIGIWSIVSIPIKNNISYWVVYGFEAETEFDNVRAIVWSVCSFPIISEYQLWLIFAIANRYFLPVHKVLNLFLPKFVFNRFDKNAFQDVIWLDNFLKNETIQADNAFIHNSSSIWVEKIMDLEKLSERWAVLVFGDDFAVDYFLERNQKYKKDALVYKNSMTYAKKYNLFLDVLSKKKNILIWTRKILQYNLARYENIVYLEDALVRYNYNQFEKYRNLDIMEFLTDTKKFNVTFISSVPSVELFLMSKKKRFSYKII